MLAVAQTDAGQWWRWGGSKREWQWCGLQVLQPGSCSLAGQANRGHPDSTRTLWPVEEAVARAGTAGLSRVSTAKPAWNRFFCCFKAMPISHSALEKSEWAAPLWEIGCRVLPSSSSLARPASLTTVATILLLSPREPCTDLTRAPSAVRGLQPKWPLWGGTRCHNGPAPVCSGLPSAGDSPAKEHLLAGFDLGLTAPMLGKALYTSSVRCSGSQDLGHFCRAPISTMKKQSAPKKHGPEAQQDAEGHWHGWKVTQLLHGSDRLAWGRADFSELCGRDTDGVI